MKMVYKFYVKKVIFQTFNMLNASFLRQYFLFKLLNKYSKNIR